MCRFCSRDFHRFFFFSLFCSWKIVKFLPAGLHFVDSRAAHCFVLRTDAVCWSHVEAVPCFSFAVGVTVVGRASFERHANEMPELPGGKELSRRNCSEDHGTHPNGTHRLSRFTNEKCNITKFRHRRKKLQVLCQPRLVLEDRKIRLFCHRNRAFARQYFRHCR